jgi:hypothetical protein
MDPQLEAPDTDGDDEVAHQRRKHWAASLGKPVPGFPEMTLSNVVADVLAATAEAGRTLDVAQFLSGRGHSQETIETVQGYLDLSQPREPWDNREPRVTIDGASGDRRLRAVAQLQAMLLDD